MRQSQFKYQNQKLLSCNLIINGSKRETIDHSPRGPMHPGASMGVPRSEGRVDLCRAHHRKGDRNLGLSCYRRFPGAPPPS